MQVQSRKTLFFNSLPILYTEEAETEQRIEQSFKDLFTEVSILKLEDLDTYVLQNQLLTTNVKDLLALCATNKRLRTICDDNYFWKRKYLLDFGRKGITQQKRNKDVEIDWKDSYFKMYNPERGLVELFKAAEKFDDISEEKIEFYKDEILQIPIESRRGKILEKGMLDLIHKNISKKLLFDDMILMLEILSEIKYIPSNQGMKVLCKFMDTINPLITETFENILYNYLDSISDIANIKKSYNILIECAISSKDPIYIGLVLSSIKSRTSVMYHNVEDMIDIKRHYDFLNEIAEGEEEKILKEILDVYFG